MDPTIQQLAVTLGLSVTQVLLLLNHPAMPAPSSGYGLTASWAAGPAAAFATLWAAVLANGWKVSSAALATAPLTLMSTTTPGPYYRPPLSDPLFDDYP
jgi:hypothetical protein